MSHNNNDQERTPVITLAEVAAGTTVLLDDQAVELDQVDQLGICRARGSAAYGLRLTKVGYLRRGQHRERIYPSKTSVVRLAG